MESKIKNSYCKIMTPTKLAEAVAQLKKTTNRLEALSKRWNWHKSSRYVTGYSGISLWIRPRVKPYYSVVKNKRTGVTVYMIGLLYFSLLISNPFKKPHEHSNPSSNC